MRFRKRITLFPGVRLNLSGSGVSTTIGPRGLNVNMGRRGTYLNTGIPGTGLYDRQRLDGPTRRTSATVTASVATSAFSDSEQALRALLWYRHYGWVLVAASVSYIFDHRVAIALAVLAGAMFVARHATPAGRALNTVLKARRQWDQQNHDDALRSLMGADVLSPLPQLHRDIATVAMHMGNNETAISHLQRIAAPDTDDRIDLAGALFNSDRNEEAAVIYRQLSESLPQGALHGSVTLRLAMSLYGAKEYRDALVAYQQVPPDLASANYLNKMIGICFYHMGDTPTAIFTLEKAVGRKRNLDSDLMEMCYLLGRIHAERQDIVKAKHWFTKVYTRDINYKDVSERLKTLQ